MTGQPQHPQRCETCGNVTDSKVRIGYKKCKLSNMLLDSNFDMFEHSSIVGCASHSSAGAQQQRIEQVIKELEKRIEQSKDEVAQAYMQDTIALLQAGDQHE